MTEFAYAFVALYVRVCRQAYAYTYICMYTCMLNQLKCVKY